jgi:biopolymer transport protein ExbD
MAGVDLAVGAKRPMNADINMIPFVDLLLVTVAFLLVTAVWVEHARLDVNASPTGSSPEPTTSDDLPRVLDVEVGEREVVLSWKQGKTTITRRTVERASTADMARAFEREWREHGAHAAIEDPRADEAVLRSNDHLPFKDLVSVMDALYAPHRDLVTKDGRRLSVPVFAPTFSAK